MDRQQTDAQMDSALLSDCDVVSRNNRQQYSFARQEVEAAQVVVQSLELNRLSLTNFLASRRMQDLLVVKR